MAKTKLIKKLREILPKISGRDRMGHVSVRHQGGRHKRFYRVIDYKRDKIGVPAKVVSLEYDPNRNIEIALLAYKDGEKRYILCPLGLKVGSEVISGTNIDANVGNCLPLETTPVGTIVHNLELRPNQGGKLIRSAGGMATVLAKENQVVHVKLPSGEIRIFSQKCRATVGQLGNIDWKNRKIGKAGRSRHLGIRPTVRGVAQNPRSHPHGGGEGRSGIGMSSPKSPWGKHTLGKKTRSKRKYSDKFILQRRK